MVKEVIAIIKKHLDRGRSSYEDMWEALETTPYEVLTEFPDYHALRHLARELIIEIRGVDVSKLVNVPNQEETKDFLRRNLPHPPDEDFLDMHARDLRTWLAGYRHNYFPPRAIIRT